MAVSTAFATQYLEGVFGTDKGANAPATLYIALSSTTPGMTAGVIDNVTEPSTSGTAYARVAVTNSDANFTTSGRVTSSAAAIEFPTATASWGATLTHVVVYDAATNGNALVSGALATPLSVPSGVRVVIDAGSVTFTVPS